MKDTNQLSKALYQAGIDFSRLLHSMGIHWDELSNIADMIGRIQSALDNRQETNLLDVEDVMQEVVINVYRYDMRRDFGQAVYWVIDRNGKKEDDSPSFVELIGHMNDDDLQASDNGEELKVDNDMSSVASPDAGPGSDLHIAEIDIEDKLGEKYRDVFEAKIAGEMRTEICNAFDMTEKEVRWCEGKIEELLKRGQYTLDTTNRRLGTARKFDAGKSFFPAERRVKRTWALPDVDHRSTNFVEPFEFDNTPVAPCGDEVNPSPFVFDSGTAEIDYRRHIALLDVEVTEETVQTVEWEKYPNGYDPKKQSQTMSGDPASWKPFASTAYGVKLYNTIPGVEKLPVPRDAQMEQCEVWWRKEREIAERKRNSEN